MQNESFYEPKGVLLACETNQIGKWHELRQFRTTFMPFFVSGFSVCQLSYLTTTFVARPAVLTM